MLFAAPPLPHAVWRAAVASCCLACRRRLMSFAAPASPHVIWRAAVASCHLEDRRPRLSMPFINAFAVPPFTFLPSPLRCAQRGRRAGGEAATGHASLFIADLPPTVQFAPPDSSHAEGLPKFDGEYSHSLAVISLCAVASLAAISAVHRTGASRCPTDSTCPW